MGELRACSGLREQKSRVRGRAEWALGNRFLRSAHGLRALGRGLEHAEGSRECSRLPNTFSEVALRSCCEITRRVGEIAEGHTAWG